MEDKHGLRYPVGRAAKELKIHPNTLRKMEMGGKIPRAQRDRNGFRFWYESDLARIREFLERVVEAPARRKRA